jgi:hypothetical protein
MERAINTAARNDRRSAACGSHCRIRSRGTRLAEEDAMTTTTSALSRGELRLLALAAVNDELGQAIARLVDGRIPRLSDISFHDRIRLKEMELENDLRLRGIAVTRDD